MKYRLVLLFLWSTSKLPLRILHYIGHIVGILLYIFPNKSKYVSQLNINSCFPNQSVSYRDNLLRKSLIELGKTILELGPLWLWPTEKLLSLVKEIHGIDPLEACLEGGRGLFAATPHLGAWELCGLVGSSRYPFTAMYRPPRIKELEPWIIQSRERAGARLVDYGRQGIKEMIQSLKKGEVVGILPDQEPRDSGGVFAPFFGVPAYTMTILSKLARKTGAAVFFAYMERLPKGQGYRLIINQAEDGIDSDDEQAAANALNQSIEACINACPEQYMWAYRRFKQRPSGEPPIYS
jgi:KDO2-lipid IV(A) lauroyltransferase